MRCPVNPWCNYCEGVPRTAEGASAQTRSVATYEGYAVDRGEVIRQVWTEPDPPDGEEELRPTREPGHAQAWEPWDPGGNGDET